MDVNNTPTIAVHEHPLNFDTTIASLEYLAATSVALDLWHHNQLGHFSMPRGEYNKPNFTCGQVLHISLPQRVKKTIDERICSMGRELQDLYNSFAHFGVLPNYIFLKYIDSLTYGPDGEMSSERNAKNILSCNELEQWQRFRIACVYWLEDEIRQIWPSVSDHPNPNLADVFGFHIRYWVAKMQNDSVLDVQLYDLLRMLNTANDVGNWTAYTNVLNTLTPNLQYDVIKSAARSGAKNLLPKLNEVQLDYILSKIPDHIIIGLALQNGGYKYAIKIWNVVRERIEYTRFYEILRYVRRYVYDPDKYDVSFFIRTQAQAVLLEIWNTAPNRLKIEFFNNETKVDRLFEYLSEIEIKNFHRLDDNTNFISKLFSDLPTDMRSRIWRKYWPYIIYFSPPKMLNHLLSLSLTKDYKEFVEKEMMNYRKVRFIMKRWFDNLRLYDDVFNYTKLCSWNEQLVRQFRTHIFIRSTFSNFYYLIQLGAAIDKNLPNTEAKEAKRTILFSYGLQNQNRIKLFVDLRKILAKEAIDIIDSFWPTERSEREKQFFSDPWHKFLIRGVKKHCHFYQRWSEFLSWWLDNKDDLPIFKQFLSEYESFDELLLQMLSTRVDDLKLEVSEPAPALIGKLKDFADVDGFLMWYFGNEEAVKNYKRSKISNYEKFPQLNDLLLVNDQTIASNRVIAWFFNYDEIEIGNFEKEFYQKHLSN